MARKRNDIQTFEHDGHTVVFTEIEPKMREDIWDRSKLRPQERRRYEVRVDGDLIALAIFPYGAGKQSIVVQKVHGELYSPIYGDRDAIRNGYQDKNYEPSDLVPEIVRRRFSAHTYEKLVTREEADAAHRARATKEKREREIADERRGRERVQRRRDLNEQVETRTNEIEAITELQDRSDLNNIQAAALQSSLQFLKADLRAARDALGRMDEWEQRQ